MPATDVVLPLRPDGATRRSFGHSTRRAPSLLTAVVVAPSPEGRMAPEIVILFSLWVSKQGTALTARNCTTSITDGFYEAMHCTNCRLYCDANSIAGLFSVAHQPPARRMYSCESGFLNAVWDPLWSVLTFTCGLNGFEYANCVKQTYRVNTKKKTHVYLPSTISTSFLHPSGEPLALPFSHTS